MSTPMSDPDQILAIAKLEGRDLTHYRFRFQTIGRDTPQWSPPYRHRQDAQEVSDAEVRRWSSKVWPVEPFVDTNAAPRYLESLDAVAEVEGLAIRSFRDEHLYVGMLCQISAPRNTVWSPLRALACASAADRCEALLRLKGLWTGDDSP